VQALFISTQLIIHFVHEIAMLNKNDIHQATA